MTCPNNHPATSYYATKMADPRGWGEYGIHFGCADCDNNKLRCFYGCGFECQTEAEMETHYETCSYENTLDDEDGDETTYKIVRFHQSLDIPNETIVRGLTLEQAQAHCQREDTHGDGWFDGYDEES